MARAPLLDFFILAVPRCCAKVLCHGARGNWCRVRHVNGSSGAIEWVNEWVIEGGIEWVIEWVVEWVIGWGAFG